MTLKEGLIVELKNLKDEILLLLKTQNDDQGLKIRNAEEKIGKLESQMALLLTSNAKPPRRTRSVTTASVVGTGESSWSKLEMSPVEIGSMLYGDYAIKIYGHSSNKLATTTSDEKQAQTTSNNHKISNENQQKKIRRNEVLGDGTDYT